MYQVGRGGYCHITTNAITKELKDSRLGFRSAEMTWVQRFKLSGSNIESLPRITSHDDKQPQLTTTSLATWPADRGCDENGSMRYIHTSQRRESRKRRTRGPSALEYSKITHCHRKAHLSTRLPWIHLSHLEGEIPAPLK